MGRKPRAAEPPADDELDELPEPEADEGDEQDEQGEPEPDLGDGDEDEDAEGDETDEQDEGDETDEDEGETVVAFADEETEADEGDATNTVIRRVRERNKELARENAELRKAREAGPPAEIEIGPKPTFADANFDEDTYEKQLDEWKERKARADAAKRERDAAETAAQREWERDLEAYTTAKASLGKADFDEVIEPVKASLSLPQQAVILKAAQNPAAFSYALAGSDARLAELAKISDPIKLAAAIARMEGGVTVTKHRKAPPPDRPARGSARLPTADKQLEKLEAEAEKTGDRTKLIRYKSQQAERGKKAARR